MFFLFYYFCCKSKQAQWVDEVGLFFSFGEKFDIINNIDNRHVMGYCIADPTYKNAPLALIKM